MMHVVFNSLCFLWLLFAALHRFILWLPKLFRCFSFTDVASANRLSPSGRKKKPIDMAVNTHGPPKLHMPTVHPVPGGL